MCCTLAAALAAALPAAEDGSRKLLASAKELRARANLGAGRLKFAKLDAAAALKSAPTSRAYKQLGIDVERAIVRSKKLDKKLSKEVAKWVQGAVLEAGDKGDKVISAAESDPECNQS
jgi:hypothetical protein